MFSEMSDNLALFSFQFYLISLPPWTTYMLATLSAVYLIKAWHGHSRLMSCSHAIISVVKKLF